MWSLPDIKRLNKEAESKFFQRQIKKAVKKHLDAQGNPLTCNYCANQAEEVFPYFDIFSNHPKGVLCLCADHYEQYEGYFFCESCERLMLENYTWENYYHIEHGSLICLRCYASAELAKTANWIDLRNGEVDALTFDRVRQAKHLIGVEMPIPQGIRFVGNVKFDSASGGRLRDSSSADATPNAGVEEIKDLLMRAKEEGHDRAILILDGAYQFAVSIGVYVSNEEK